ncbi:GNAT family N-acetyltransferase [Erwinia endophytica]|uniref:GNAT family N-acetyltransferase n=1 Tax=Erwinia endophytica TaxID=1563158 RepID=UPI001265F3B5|nr:GNAT family N-acetyltransferase [Erwinia endophytica]KAB8312231.1 GNAT family N-acetyltransferase [Erwinia endophytica]
MDVNWLDLHHSELTVTQLYQILALRNAVFIVEQHCPYQDVDGADLNGENRHLLGMLDNQLLAYARLLAPETDDKPVKIGRVIVSGEARGLSLGYRLMEQAITLCEYYWPQYTILLSAQAHLQGFYARFGFQPVSEPYLEDNIRHIDMEKSCLTE